MWNLPKQLLAATSRWTNFILDRNSKPFAILLRKGKKLLLFMPMRPEVINLHQMQKHKTSSHQLLMVDHQQVCIISSVAVIIVLNQVAGLG